MKNNFTQALKELTGFDGVLEQGAAIGKKDAILMEEVRDFSSENVEQKVQTEVVSFQAFCNSPSEHSTRISKSMVIKGDVNANDDVYVQGEIIGDITTTANIHGSNMILGNVSAQNMYTDTMRIKGNVTIEQDLIIGEKSVVVGDIVSGNLILSGKVKGNCDARETVRLTKGAYLLGDVCTDDFTTEQGAKLQGKVTQKTATDEIGTEFDFGGEF